jgi:hypothetical protein
VGGTACIQLDKRKEARPIHKSFGCFVLQHIRIRDDTIMLDKVRLCGIVFNE